MLKHPEALQMSTVQGTKDVNMFSSSLKSYCYHHIFG
jgi:hypothetical protein